MLYIIGVLYELLLIILGVLAMSRRTNSFGPLTLQRLDALLKTTERKTDGTFKGTDIKASVTNDAYIIQRKQEEMHINKRNGSIISSNLTVIPESVTRKIKLACDKINLKVGSQ